MINIQRSSRIDDGKGVDEPLEVKENVVVTHLISTKMD